MYRCTRGTTTVSLEQYRQFVVRNMRNFSIHREREIYAGAHIKRCNSMHMMRMDVLSSAAEENKPSVAAPPTWSPVRSLNGLLHWGFGRQGTP
jgi:hypothetical protein